MYPQLNLDIQLRVEFRLDNFIAAAPAAIELQQRLSQLTALREDQPLFIHGDHGAGKSHLLQSACQLAGELEFSCCYLPLTEITQATPNLFTNLEQLDLICIDDVHTLAGQPDWETALFNLFNHCRDQQCRLIFASRLRPTECGFQLADLTSRLGWGVVYALPNLDDSHKRMLVNQRAKELGLTFDEATCDYIMQRCHRQTGQLMQFLDQLDQHSLAGQRKITIPLVREVIGQQAGIDDQPELN